MCGCGIFSWSRGNRIVAYRHLQSLKPGLSTLRTSPSYVLEIEWQSPLADLFASFLDLPYPSLLDSASPGPGGRQFSYLVADPFLVVRSKGRRVWVESEGPIKQLDANPFDTLSELLSRYACESSSELPPFQGGAVGYFAYELGRHLERLPAEAIDDLSLPELTVGFYDWVIARDEADGRTWIISTGLPDGDRANAERKAKWVRERAFTPPPETRRQTVAASALRSGLAKPDYLDAVSAVKRYIVAGDVYQVNLSQRFQAELKGDPWSLYRSLRDVNPAPFGAYLDYPEFAVLSASPEMFLELSGRAVTTRPMKGTRPRFLDPAADRASAAELAASEKDRAENVMIVDLMRNDLGRVCLPGTVRVPQLFKVEQYQTVHQMISVVNGTLRPDLGPVDLLKACFPGGSITGAPKIRAMEIIDELESTQRSVYCGAIGYIGFDGSMSMSMPIRILLVKDGTAYFQVGGGIVYDSDPQAEYQETLDKARGSLLALGLTDPPA